MYKLTLKVVAITVVTGITVFFAQAASAVGTRTLPAGETLNSVIYGTSSGGIYSMRLAEVTPTTAATSFPGSSTVSGGDMGPGSYDPITNTGYWLAYTNSGPGYTFKLISVDLVTGANSVVGEIALNGTAKTNMAGLAIGADGVAYAYDDSGVFFSVNLTSGALTTINSSSTGRSAIYGFAYNPADQLFYGLRAGTLYTVNVSTGALTSVQTGFPSSATPIAFDGSGILWGIENYSNLFSTQVTPGVAAVKETAGPLDSFSLILNYEGTPAPPAPTPVTPATPTLAITGIDSTKAWALGVTGGVIVIWGGILLLIARRNKRS